MTVAPARAVRAAAAPVRLAAARLRAAPGRWLLAAGGIAVAVALLGAATGGGAAAGERAARAILDRGPAADRTVRLSWAGGLPPGTAARARRMLAGVTREAPTQAVVLQPRTVAGRLVQLTGIESSGRWLRLRAGRLPRRCGPLVCEVVQVGGPRLPDRLDGRPGQDVVLHVVGRATLASSVPLGFAPASARATNPGVRAPAIVVGGAAGVEALPGLAGVFRTNSWTAPLDTGGIPSWRLDRVRARIAATRARLESASDAFAIDAPLGVLGRAAARAAAARRRVAFVGGAAAALLAAFVLLAAGALRRDLGAERARLERRGARRWQGGLLTLAECAAAALAGVLAGGAAALAVVAARGGAGGIGADTLLGHTLLSPPALLAAFGCWVAATALLALAPRERAAGGVPAGVLLALAAAGALALALARGGVSASDVARGGDPLPALLPLLACLVGGLLVAGAAVPALRLGERAARRGPLAVRLAALGLARSPRTAAVTVAVVAVTAGLACFAAAYGATLRRGASDEAAFRIPLDARIASGPGFTRPLEAAGPTRWRALAGGGPVLPVVRAGGILPGQVAERPIALLGVPAAGLPRLRGWRDGDASAGRAQLARRLAPGGPLHPRGPLLPAGTRRLAVRARAAGDGVELTARLVTPAGEPVAVVLGTAGPAARVLAARLPRGAGHLRLAALELAVPAGLLATQGHREAEGGSAQETPRGRLVLGPLRARGPGAPGATVATYAGWVGRGAVGGPTPVPGGGVRVGYVFDRSGRALLRPVQPTDGRPLPVVTDRTTAAEAGRRATVALNVEGEQLSGRVVGTVARLPTVGPASDRFALADESTLATALDADAPGAGAAGELWLGVRGPAAMSRLAAALRRRPLADLRLASRPALEERLRGDPLAVELRRVLAQASVLALALAALGVLLATAAALRDEAAELYDLEAQGVAPAALRATVRLRAVLLAALGLLAGLVLGGVLLALVVDAVQVTAGLGRPVPPLVAVVPWGAWAAGAAAFLAVALGAVGLATRRAFGEDVPRRAARATG